MRQLFRTFSVVVAVAMATGPSAAVAEAEAPTVIELFTSQGCSACPPADKLLGEFAGRPGVIALSLAVDYWDYLGWKDTLANPAHSARQRAYADSRGDRRLYTPQVIVNGRDSAPGHDRAAIERAMRAARGAGPVGVTARAQGGRVEIKVASGDGTASVGEIWALGVQRRVAVEIGRGENAGRLATYHNIVRRMTRVATWTGGDVSLRVTTADVADGDCDIVVVLVQDMPHGRLGSVVGATVTELR